MNAAFFNNVIHLVHSENNPSASIKFVDGSISIVVVMDRYDLYHVPNL